MRLGLVLVFSLFVACGTPRIKHGDTTVHAPRDAGTPAVVDSGETKTAFDVPAETKLSTTVVEAVPATSSTPFVPSRTVTEWSFMRPTRFEQIAATLQASTGTVDTSIAKHRIDVGERRWLLFTAIGCGIAGILARSLVPAWPSISNGLLGAAVLAGLAWKFAEIPAWLFLVTIGLAGLVVAVYKRAEWDANGDGIPDALQKK